MDNEATPLSSGGNGPGAGVKSTSGWRWLRFIGPGMLVCLADTDAGCLIVAAQSGARWGYALLPLQLVLIPVLFLAQELTVRLAVHTRKGHTACIRDSYGPFWAKFSCFFLVVGCIGGVISEMSGIASVAELWGCSRELGTLIAAALVLVIVALCNYRQIETIGVVFGLFELTFVFTMVYLHPSPMDVMKGSFTWHNDSEYHKLIAANVGAVIMPWMIYFQQSAVVARKVHSQQEMEEERKYTCLGSILTQLIMIGALVTLAATPNVRNLETVTDIQYALAPVFGDFLAKVLLSMAFVGGSLCAAFVVALAAAWAICEAFEVDDAFALDRRPSEAPAFYGSFLAVVLVGMGVLFTGVSIVALNIYVELMDALLMPMAVGFLFLLATQDSLPTGVRVQGLHKYLTAVTFSICSLVALATGISGILGSSNEAPAPSPAPSLL